MSDLTHRMSEIRPWGEFVRFTLNEPSTVKLLTVQAGAALSLQTHENRDEFWRVVGGTGKIHIGDRTHTVGVGDEFWCARTIPHRMEGVDEDLVVLEIAFGQFDEADITHLEDQYGRV